MGLVRGEVDWIEVEEFSNFISKPPFDLSDHCLRRCHYTAPASIDKGHNALPAVPLNVVGEICWFAVCNSSTRAIED